ncbi:leucine-rich repeat-containing protein 66 [Xenopus tropicalis]|uniref:Leucine-rich repeat-containing protein 66 n=1 Tax=Xenopus tropicalis TaxID=8364 RepID=A0A8J0SVB1_XENTR|nr:leucine-rich repeat-containing protein 66 [Xenopus tropicalis]
MLLVSELVPITRQYPAFLKYSECRGDKIHSLDCSFTGITALPSYSVLWSPKMEGLNPETFIRSMKHINLSNNAISELHLGIFYNCSELEILHFNDNHIISVLFDIILTKNSEEFLRSLKTLSVERNQLSAVPKGFGKLNSLQTLSLAGNRISQIQQDDFANCTKLKRIDLGSNAVYKIHPNAFSDVTELQVLKLSSNALVTITPMAFLYIHMLQAEIDLSNNPWACDCGIIFLERLSLLLPKDLIKQWNLACSTPPARTLLHLLTTDDSHSTCDLLIDDSVFIKGIILPAGETAILHCNLPGTLGRERTFWWTPQGIVSEEHHDPRYSMNKEKNLLLHSPENSEEGLYVCFFNNVQRGAVYQVYVQQDVPHVLRRSPRYIESRNTRMRTEGDFALAVTLSVIITFLCSFCLGVFLRPFFEKLWRKHCNKKNNKDQPSDVVYENTGYTEESNVSNTNGNDGKDYIPRQNEIPLGQDILVHKEGTCADEITVLIKPLCYPVFVVANDEFTRPMIVKSKKSKHLFPKDTSKISQHPTQVKEGMTDTEHHTNKEDLSTYKDEINGQPPAQDSNRVNAPHRHKEKIYAPSSDSELSISDDGSLFSFSRSNSLSEGSETLEVHSDTKDSQLKLSKDSLHEYCRSDDSDEGETDDQVQYFPFVRFYDKRDIGKKLTFYYCETSAKNAGDANDGPILPTMDGNSLNNTDILEWLKTTSEEDMTTYESDHSDYETNLQSSKQWQHWSGKPSYVHDAEDLLSSPALQSTCITNAEPVICFHDKLDIGKKLTFFYHDSSTESTEDAIDGTVVPAVDGDSNKDDSIKQWLDNITGKIGELQLPLTIVGPSRHNEESSILEEDNFSFSSSSGQSENICTIKQGLQDYGTDDSDTEMHLQSNNGQDWSDNQNLLHASLGQNIPQDDIRTTLNEHLFYPSSWQPTKNDENSYGTVLFYDKLDIGKKLKFAIHETLFGSAVADMDRPMVFPESGVDLYKAGDTASWTEMNVDEDVRGESQLPFFTSGHFRNDSECSTSSEDQFSYPSSPEPYDSTDTIKQQDLQDYGTDDSNEHMHLESNNDGQDWSDNIFQDDKTTTLNGQLFYPSSSQPTKNDENNYETVCFYDKWDIGKKLKFVIHETLFESTVDVMDRLMIFPISGVDLNKAGDTDSWLEMSVDEDVTNQGTVDLMDKPMVFPLIGTNLNKPGDTDSWVEMSVDEDFTKRAVDVMDHLIVFPESGVDLNKAGDTDSWVEMNVDEDVRGESQLPLVTSGHGNYFTNDVESSTSSGDQFSYPSSPEHYDYALTDYENNKDIVVCFSDKMEIGKKLSFFYENKPIHHIEDINLPLVLQPSYTIHDDQNIDEILVCFSDKMEIGKNLNFTYEMKPTMKELHPPPILQPINTLYENKNKDDTVVRFSDKMEIGKKLTLFYKNEPAIPKKDFILPPVLKSDYIQDNKDNKDNILVCFSDKMYIGKKLTFFYEDKTVLPNENYTPIPVLKEDYTQKDYKNKDEIVVRFSDKMEIGKKLSFFYENKPTHHIEELDLPLVLQPNYTNYDDQNIDDILVSFSDKMEIGKKLNFIYESKPTLTMKELHPPLILQPIYTLSEKESNGDTLVRFSDKIHIGKKLTFFYEEKTELPNPDFISVPILKADYTPDHKNKDEIVVRFSDKMEIGKKLSFFYENKPTHHIEELDLPLVLQPNYTNYDDQNIDDILVSFSDKMEIGKKLNFIYESKPTLTMKELHPPLILQPIYTPSEKESNGDTVVCFSDKMHIGKKFTLFYKNKPPIPKKDFILLPALRLDYIQDKNKDNTFVRFSDKIHIGKKLTFFYEEKTELPNPDLISIPILKADVNTPDHKNKDDIVVRFSDKMEIGKKLNFIYKSKPTLTMKELNPPPIYTHYKKESNGDTVVRFFDKMDIGRKLRFCYENKPTIPIVDFISQPVLKDYTLNISENGDDTVVRFSDKLHIGKKLIFFYKDKTVPPTPDFISIPILKVDYAQKDYKNKDDIVVRFSDKMEIGKKFSFFYENKPTHDTEELDLPLVLQPSYTVCDDQNIDDVLVCFSDKMEIGKNLKFFYKNKPAIPIKDFIPLPVLQSDYIQDDNENKDNTLVRFSDKVHIGKKFTFFYKDKTVLPYPDFISIPVSKADDAQKDYKGKDDIVIRFSDKMNIGKRFKLCYENKPAIPKTDFVSLPAYKSEYTLDDSRQTVYEIPDIGETNTDDLIDFETERSQLINSPPKTVMLDNSGQYFTKRKRVFDGFTASYV